MKYEVRTYTVQSPFGGPDRTVIHSAEDAVRIVRAVLAEETHHDKDQHTIVALDLLPGMKPTTDKVSAYLVRPIEVFRAAAAFGAVSTIVCHKSPPGDQSLAAADYLGAPVHDPVVVDLDKEGEGNESEKVR